jgi:hypothetical protein
MLCNLLFSYTLVMYIVLKIFLTSLAFFVEYINCRVFLVEMDFAEMLFVETHFVKQSHVELRFVELRFVELPIVEMYLSK